MKSSLVFSTILCVTAWMAGVYASNGPVSSCCDYHSKTRVSLNKIVHYEVQSAGLCDITAIVFTTKNKNKTSHICSDPQLDWTKRAMKKVDLEKSRGEEMKMVNRKETSQGPAVSRNPQKKMRGRKRQTKGRRNRSKQRKNVKTTRRV